MELIRKIGLKYLVFKNKRKYKQIKQIRRVNKKIYNKKSNEKHNKIVHKIITQISNHFL